MEQCPSNKPKSTPVFLVVFHLLAATLSLQALHRKNASQTSTVAKLTAGSNSYSGPGDLATFNDTDSVSGYLEGKLLGGNRRLCCVSVGRLSDRNWTPSSGMEYAISPSLTVKG